MRDPLLAEYQQLISDIGGILWESDARDFVWTSVSEEVSTLLGYPVAHWTRDKHSWLEAVLGEDRERVAGVLRDAVGRGRGCRVEFRAVTAAGKVVWLLALVELLKDGAGRIRGLRGLACDISEQKKTQEELSKLSSVAQQTADSIMITDREGVVEYVNPAFEKLTGYRAPEMVGQKPSVLKSGKMTPAFYEKLWQTILAGKPFRGVFLNRRRNGDLYYMDNTISALKDERGEITHFVSAGRDKTEQKRAEEEERRLQAALENAAREWKLTFDAVESAILIADKEGAIRRLNRAACELLGFGLSFDDVLGSSIAQFSSAEPWQSVKELLSDTGNSGQPGSRQTREPKSGKSWVVNVSPFLDPSLEKKHIIITLRDITAVVELQESLRKSETMSVMGTLVAGVAHEVRNPLFCISATLDAFEARIGVRAEYQEYVRILRQELDRLNGLMQDLLDYGRPARLNLVDTTLGPIVAGAIQACGTLAQKAGVEITWQVVPELPQVRADARRIVEVFRNLLENAIQHSPKGGQVAIEACCTRDEQESWVECVVRDQGPGFREEDLPHLFDPFFTRRRGGTGMGLAIVERAIEQHGGRIIARNRREGGAEVLVSLRACPGT